MDELEQLRHALAEALSRASHDPDCELVDVSRRIDCATCKCWKAGAYALLAQRP